MYGYNLEILNNLLRVRIIKNSLLVSQFGFSNNEAKILKFVISNFIDGQVTTDVSDILAEVFSATKLKEKLEYVEIIHDLKDKGHVDSALSGLFMFETSTKHSSKKTPLLELLNASISVTSSFMLFLENRDEVIEELSTQPYTNSFQYLEDKFHKITICFDSETDSENFQEKADLIESIISKKLEQSTLEIPLAKILKDKNLSTKEEMIFLAVLSEEYSIFEMKNFRKIESLIDLISFKGVEKFENRSLFREDSVLVKESLFEFETSVHIISENKSFTSEDLYVSEDILREIEGVPNKKKRENRKDKLKELVEKQEIFELIEPKKDLASVILPQKTREIMDTIVKQLDKKVINRLVKWGMREKKTGLDARIIFHGSAGTGKTMSAVALAKTLKKDVLHFDCSKVLSMYVGESEKNVRNIFDTYKDLVKNSGLEPILFLNEADQFLSSRSTDTGNSISQMYNQMQNIFLEQIENFDGVLVATTNMIDNLDKAFSRRFNYKVEFKPPSKIERVAIWKEHIPKNAEFETNFSVENLADFKLTGGQIDLIVKNTAFKVATKDNPIFKNSDFLEEIKREKNTNFESDKIMGFLK